MMQIVVPYGNAYAQNHLAYGNKDGDVTMCGRECYGWSYVRPFKGSDLDSAYTCKRCAKAAAK